MDFYVRLIGLILVINGGTHPDVAVNTAFAPPWRSGLTFCSGTKIVPEHAVFIRVSTAQVIKNDTNWPGEKPCDDPKEHCTLFPITQPSEITIDPGFTPPASSTTGTTFKLIPRPGKKIAGFRAVAKPETFAMATLKMPGGSMEGQVLGNGTAITTVRVVPPASTPNKPITIKAVPNAGGTAPTLTVKEGTTINVVNLPPHHAGVDLDMANPAPDPDHLHFFLLNALLPAKFHFCKPPKAAPDLDPLCSNQGCCP